METMDKELVKQIRKAKKEKQDKQVRKVATSMTIIEQVIEKELTRQ